MEFINNPLVAQALSFARVSLAGKKRKSGEEVVDHCLRIAQTLVKFKITDPVTLAVAILHHSVADGAATYEDIRQEFGEEIALMIEAFDRLEIVKLKFGAEDEFIEHLRQMFLNLAKDLRVVLVKMADILDNLETLKYLKKEKGKEVAEETLEIFAPLAERLGMGEMRGQMQDLAFAYLYPKEFEWVKKYTKTSLAKLDKALLKVKSELFMVFQKEGIKAEIQGRKKHVYSLYTKLTRPEINKDLSKVYDLIALRIIVSTEEDCYKILDLIHKLFKLLPEPMSDYIAYPKPNGYQSIHTRVYGPFDLPFEIQIRTGKMHEEAEYGLAAHWNYAEKKESGLTDEKISRGFAASAEKLEWVKRLSEWQKEITDNQEFLKTIKTDFLGARILCFTPKGDVKDLPAGATPVDFAYYVHTDLGNRVIGAKINGKQITLDSKLKNGDVVELTLAKDLKKKPSRDWLNFVVTGLARRKIRKAYSLD